MEYSTVVSLGINHVLNHKSYFSDLVDYSQVHKQNNQRLVQDLGISVLYHIVKIYRRHQNNNERTRGKNTNSKINIIVSY